MTEDKPSLPTYPPMITLKGDLIPIAPDFAAALASVVLEWSRVELGLQTDLEGMRLYPGMKKIAPRMPRMFDPLLKTWRQTVRELYVNIESYQTFADHISSRATDLSLKRNHLIHGLWEISGVNAQGLWPVHNYRRVSGGHFQILKADVDLDSLRATARGILALGGDTAGFTSSRLYHLHLGILKIDRASKP